MMRDFVELLARSPREMMAVDIVAKATLVLAAAAAFSLALRRSSAASRHLAWCAGLGAALALPVLFLAMPGWSWRVLPAASETARLPRSSSDFPVRGQGPTSSSPGSLGAIDREEETLRTSGTAGRVPSGPTPINPIPPPVRSRVVFTPSRWWLWAAWLAGTLIVLSGPIAGRIVLSRWAREADHRRRLDSAVA